MLLKAFPGRPLEELDAMDWGRWRRAVEAQTRMDIESLRAKGLEGDANLKELPADVWAVIREHDALMEELDDGTG